MSMTREDLREAVARALCSADRLDLDGTEEWSLWKDYLADADAALSVIIPACQEGIRDRGPATQDMRSTEICEALDAAADALAVFLPGDKTNG